VGQDIVKKKRVEIEVVPTGKDGLLNKCFIGLIVSWDKMKFSQAVFPNARNQKG
jgi:hypothetical protein